MSPLFLIIGLLFAPSVSAQPMKEFKLSQQETNNILSILNETYVKLKQLPAGSTKSSNVNSIDTKEKIINGRPSFLTIDSCSEENGSSICFAVQVFRQQKYPQDIIRFTYDPATKTGLISMFRIMDPRKDGYVYESSEAKVKSTFMNLIEKINEFI